MLLRSANLIITSSVMGFLATATVILRLWSKRRRNAKITIDDHLLLLGLVGWIRKPHIYLLIS